MAPKITCPAGSYHEKDGKAGVQCKIENNFISFRENPQSLLRWCSDEYHRCPVWIAEKENDPAVDKAQGKTRMTNCPECSGAGIQKVEVLRSGLFIPDEIKCDGCIGTGKVPV